ncbi:putative ankyrin repeat protein [Botrytis fragariae]|uniref:Putative ankyrin repeat protein n=1 Tax=Botrytis fragariae TaxID=1964551 RepID=A0A8H6ECH7_9HELO|nr:putative ankyrin repeat protein [Botrytis fragariae]KAF5867509.1 putative ankyrin repeat protein [Botrytis fragariae]
MEDKQWVFYWRKKAIKIGPQFDKIVKIFKLIKPIGDTAAGLDPIHAGIPWACVSVLLPLILNHSEEQEAALSGLQKVVEIVQQFTSLSWDYLNFSQGKSEKQLKESISTLYWKILRYEATAINNFNRNTIVRHAASIVRKDEWKKLLGEVEDCKNNFMSDLQLNDSQNHKRFETELRELILQLDRTDEKNLEVIQWISDKPHISQHYTARQLLSEYPHAGEWIVEKYTKWLHQNAAPVFWLRGTIGVGKTSIMSTIVQSFYSDVARQDDQRMIYFYCISPTTSDNVIRSLVSQLAWTLDGNAIEASIVSMFNDAKPPDPTIPTTDEWSAALLKLCQRVSTVIIVIDALDECVDFSKLLAKLRKLQAKQLDGIKFVFSSRLDVDVDKVFTASEGVILTTEDTLKDMTEYIKSEVKSKEEDIGCNDEKTKRQLMDQIVLVLSNLAGGMFKWVTLQLAIMFPIETQTFLPEDIEIQLLNIKNRNTSLEQSLNSAYETVYLMKTKPGAYSTSVFKSVCKWLLCCKTALRADEVLKVIELSLDHDPKLQRITRSPLSTEVVLHCCSNFVIQNSEGNFRFAHLSVEEYLTNHCAVKVEFQCEECHFFVMKTCLAFMAPKRFESVERIKHEYDVNVRNQTRKLGWEFFTFERYSICYWAYHAKNSVPGRRCREPLYKSFALSAKLSPSLKWWFAQIDAYNYSGSMESQITDVVDEVLGDLPQSNQYPSKSRLRMLGAAFNLPEILENGINNYKEEVDAPLRDGLTPFLVAIRHSSPDSVKYLLDLGANPNRISDTLRECYEYEPPYMHDLIPVEDMMYWVAPRSRNPQRQKVRKEVKNVLLNHEKSRNHFLNQLEKRLREGIYLDLSRAMKSFYRASNEVPISAKIFEDSIKTRGLGELAQVLDLMDEETFDEEMVAEIVRHDSCETVKKFFEFKHVDSITEQMVRNAFRSYDSNTITYFMEQLGPGILTREIVIDAVPPYYQVWKVILGVKGIQFVNQEVFDSMIKNSVTIETFTFVLDSCGTEIVGSSHIVLIAGSWVYTLEGLNAILRVRGSLDDLITEEAVFKALLNRNFDVATFLLENAEDAPSLLTERIKDVANHSDNAGMLVLEKFANSTCD